MTTLFPLTAYVPLSLPYGPLELKVPSALNSQDQSPFIKAPFGNEAGAGDGEDFAGAQPTKINTTKKRIKADFIHPLMVLLLPRISIFLLLPYSQF
jgi:hypothetical protein